MEALSKDDIKYKINGKDYEIVKDYLKEVEKRSHGSYRNNKGIILDCLNYINKDLKKIGMLDIKSYLENVIDIRNICYDSKKTYRSYLKSFFDYVEAILLKENVEFRNPVPNERVFKFTRKDSDIKKQSDAGKMIYTNLELLNILQLAKKKKLRDFILFSLLIITGARIVEILSIQIKDVNLEGRFFETGFIKGARKTTRTSRESLLFFFTRNFSKYLEAYIKYLK
ncbi:MAG: tyrosine-type recombinase/integrase [Promethearchaeota archaeon]